MMSEFSKVLLNCRGLSCCFGFPSVKHTDACPWLPNAPPSQEAGLWHRRLLPPSVKLDAYQESAVCSQTCLWHLSLLF